MSMHFVLLRTIERFLDDYTQTFYALLVNTGIYAQYFDQDAIVEDRSVSLVE